MGVKLYLQWYDENNSTWVTVDSSPMYYSYNAWTADATVSFPAQIGETYRAKTYHYASDGSISESRYNYTNGITLYR